MSQEEMMIGNPKVMPSPVGSMQQQQQKNNPIIAD